jgi:hypothetical protein
MPITVACPCGRRLRAPDHLAGKSARCPGCQTSVAIPAASGFEVVEDDDPPAPAPKRKSSAPAALLPPPPPQPRRAPSVPTDDDFDQQPRRRRFRPGVNPSTMKTARWGVTLLIVEIVLIFVGIVGGSGVIGIGSVTGSIPLVLTGLALVLLGVIVGPLLGAIGIGLCMSVADPEVRRPCLIALLCRITAVALSIASQFIIRDVIGRAVCDGLGTIISLVGFVMLMSGLRRLSELARSRGGADEADGLIALGIGFFIIQLAFTVFKETIPCLAALIALALLVVGVIYLFKYIRLLNYVRDAIESWL